MVISADKLREIATILDRELNGTLKGADRTCGFVLLTFPFESGTSRVDCISNAAREKIIEAMRGIIDCVQAVGTQH